MYSPWPSLGRQLFRGMGGVTVPGKAPMSPCGGGFLREFNRKISEGATAMQGPCLRNTDYGTVSLLNMKFSVWGLSCLPSTGTEILIKRHSKPRVCARACVCVCTRVCVMDKSSRQSSRTYVKTPKATIHHAHSAGCAIISSLFSP